MAKRKKEEKKIYIYIHVFLFLFYFLDFVLRSTKLMKNIFLIKKQKKILSKSKKLNINNL